jgi:hypothetical protein
MDYYIDHSYLASPSARFADFAPYEPPARSLVGGTKFSSVPVKSIDLSRTEKGPSAPTSLPKLHSESSNNFSTPAPGLQLPVDEQKSAVEKRNAVEDVATQRVLLMAAKYSKGADAVEIIARLEILNNRMLEHSPRVSREQVAVLERAQDDLLRVRAAREERAKRLQAITG